MTDPIFFAWTRSFWATALGILTLIFGAPPEVLDGIGGAIALVFDVSPQAAGAMLNRLAPAALWVVAIQQRSGAARPYTLDPTKLR